MSVEDQKCSSGPFQKNWRVSVRDIFLNLPSFFSFFVPVFLPLCSSLRYLFSFHLLIHTSRPPNDQDGFKPRIFNPIFQAYEYSFCGPFTSKIQSPGFPMGKELAWEYRGGLGWLSYWNLKGSLISYFSSTSQF